MASPKYCTSCGVSVSALDERCPACAVVVRRRCIVCGTKNSAENRFCSSCGTAQAIAGSHGSMRLLVPAKELADDTTSQGGERREVTVVFVDASNFTAAATRLDSEDVYRFIDEAMRLLVSVVARYEGTVDKFTG